MEMMSSDDWIKKSIDEKGARDQAAQEQAQQDKKAADDAFSKANAAWARIRPTFDAAVRRYNELLDTDTARQIATNQERVGNRTVTYRKPATRATVTISLGPGNQALNCTYEFPGHQSRPQREIEQVFLIERDGQFFADQGSGAGGLDVARYILERFFES
jgi:hypothetical protein